MVRLVLLTLVVLGSAVVPAAPASPAAGSASHVSAHVVPTNWHGACPHPFQFTAAIVARSAGTVYYHWERSDNFVGPRQSTTFAKAGEAREVKTAWTPAAGSGTQRLWARVQVEDGGPRSTPANFVLQCKP